MDRFSAMNVFVTVVDLKGFASAARRLGMSPPAVTRLVAALEEQLSIRLLHRTTRSLRVTDAGARYLERARRILNDVSEAESAARAERSTPRGRFVVAAPNVFGRREVAPLMADFLSAYPEVTGELTLSDRMVSLVEDGVDVAVRIGALRDSALRVLPVGATRRILVASPRYLADRKKPRRPEELAAHPLVQFTALTPLPEWRFFEKGRERSVPIEPKLVTNSADAALAHVLRSGGIAMVLSYQAQQLISDGQLEVVLPELEPPPLPIQLVYSGSRLHTASLRAFIDLVVATRQWDFVQLSKRTANARARR